MSFDALFSYKYMHVALSKNKIDFLYVGCKAGLLKIEVFPNGDVYPCVLLKLLGKIGIIKKSMEYNYINYRAVICKNKKCKFCTFCTDCPGYAINLKAIQ